MFASSSWYPNFNDRLAPFSRKNLFPDGNPSSRVGRTINSSGDPAAVKLVVWAHLIAALQASDLSHAAVDHEFEVACCRSLIASLL